MTTPRFAGDVPPALVTRGAVRAFARLFSPQMGLREASRALKRLSTRTRIVHRPESMHGVYGLMPDGADVLLLARALPGITPLAIVDCVLNEQDDEGDDMGECRRAA